ncbi:hypothetical protein [Georgenia sp. SUBG003]|uniref:hypothetical protein n=1 Tax=Georgenia sp. SUBG003 TaxID=1497974 RepID=UPI003AB8A5F5
MIVRQRGHPLPPPASRRPRQRTTPSFALEAGAVAFGNRRPQGGRHRPGRRLSRY